MPVYEPDLDSSLQTFLQLVQLLKAILQRGVPKLAKADQSRGGFCWLITVAFVSAAGFDMP